MPGTDVFSNIFVSLPMKPYLHTSLKDIRMVMELLPEDFEVKDLRVEYRVAAKLGDVLIPTLYHIDNGIIVSLAVGNEVCAFIEFT